MPQFNHPVFEELYKKDCFIDDSILREILSLGKEAAVPELEKIVAGTLQTFDPEQPSDPENVHNSWYLNFHFLHALYLLADLESEASLPVFLEVLKKRHAFQEYWFGDNIYEEVPELLARVGHNRLPPLMEAINDDSFSLHSRNLIVKSLALITVLHPEHRPDIIEFFRGYLQNVLTHADHIETAFPEDQDESYGYDIYTFLAFTLSDLEGINATELENEIRECHRKGLVDQSISGDEDDISFHDETPEVYRNIFERYEAMREWPGDDSPFNPDAENIRRRKEMKLEAERKKRAALLQQRAAASQPRLPVISGPKAGRNDPCPCGSGKKYKKCCMS